MRSKNGHDVPRERTVRPFGFETVRIPILSFIGAGKTVDLPITEWRDIRPVPGTPAAKLCAAKVTGSSLDGDGIIDGDTLIIRLDFERSEIQPGRLVAVLCPYGLLVKKIYFTMDERVRLVSSNPLYPDILLDTTEVTVQGIVVRIEHDL